MLWLKENGEKKKNICAEKHERIGERVERVERETREIEGKLEMKKKNKRVREL